MTLFVRIFLIVAAALVALVVLAFVLKVLFVAAVIAAVAFGGVVLFTALRRRFGRPAAYPMRRF